MRRDCWQRSPRARHASGFRSCSGCAHPHYGYETARPFVRGFASWLAPPGSGITVLATTATVAELLTELGGTVADVVLLELEDRTSVTDNVLALREAGASVLVVSVSDSPAAVKEAIRADAAGHVLKAEDETDPRGGARCRPRRVVDLPAAGLGAGRRRRTGPAGAQRPGATRAPALRGTAAEDDGQQDGHQRQHRQAVSAPGTAEVPGSRPARRTKVELYQRTLEDGHLPHPK